MAKKNLRSGAYVLETWSKETPATEHKSRSLREFSFRSDGYILSRLVIWSPVVMGLGSEAGLKYERHDYGWKRGDKFSPEQMDAQAKICENLGYKRTFLATEEDASTAERRGEINRESRRPWYKR